ncbi:MAG: geranylgeranylglyceryl phosphate synthase family protein [Bacteroidia bacterium]|nr:geranylgeranylglyceryl phosphate synthase family protein [Bacteroidia bacterium]
MPIHTYIQEHIKANKKMLAILLDPDDYGNVELLVETLTAINTSCVSIVLIGGSVLTTNINFNEFVRSVRQLCNKPILLFPGGGEQVSPHAHGILLLSLVSGRNPKYLIEEHVNNAIALKQSKLEILPTGYILIDAGNATSVSIVTQTQPIPVNNIALASATALAATQLGMQHIYLEAGSGATNAVHSAVINAVKNELQPQHTLWVGGGITTANKALQAIEAGANVVVVGNAVVNNTAFIYELSTIFTQLNFMQQY